MHTAPLFLHALPPTQTYTLSLHDALPISTQSSVIDIPTRRENHPPVSRRLTNWRRMTSRHPAARPPQCCSLSQEIGRAHVELQSHVNLVCRLLLEKKKNNQSYQSTSRSSM